MATRSEHEPMMAAEASKIKLQVTCRGVLLKKCRADGDRKAWKRRFFLVQGSTLYYYRAQSMAGAHKILVQLGGDGWHVKATNDRPHSAKDALAVQISNGQESYFVASHSAADRQRWVEALLAARGQPRAPLADQAHKYASRSTVMRLRMGLSAALASSTLGRKMVKRYIDDDSRQLIQVLVDYAKMLSGKSVAHAFEKGIFDIAARIAVIHNAGKFPPNLDMSLLHDETINFAQDFLVYSRDRLLSLKHDRAASEKPLNVPELLQSGSVMVELWRCILEPHCSAKVIRSFDQISGWYLEEDKIAGILRRDECLDLLKRLDRSLHAVIERY